MKGPKGKGPGSAKGPGQTGKGGAAAPGPTVDVALGRKNEAAVPATASPPSLPAGPPRAAPPKAVARAVPPPPAGKAAPVPKAAMAPKGLAPAVSVPLAKAPVPAASAIEAAVKAVVTAPAKPKSVLSPPAVVAKTAPAIRTPPPIVGAPLPAPIAKSDTPTGSDTSIQRDTPAPARPQPVPAPPIRRAPAPAGTSFASIASALSGGTAAFPAGPAAVSEPEPRPVVAAPALPPQLTAILDNPLPAAPPISKPVDTAAPVSSSGHTVEPGTAEPDGLPSGFTELQALWLEFFRESVDTRLRLWTALSSSPDFGTAWKLQSDLALQTMQSTAERWQRLAGLASRMMAEGYGFRGFASRG